MDLNDRRTIRRYADRPVSDELLRHLLSLACRASNTGNMQTYSIVVTRSEEKKRALAPAHFNQPMVTEAPVVLTFCADYNRFSTWCEQRQAVPGYDNFQSFVGAAIDAIIFAQTFAVAAEREGLGLCYLGTTTYNAGQIIDVLQLPRLVVPVTTLTVGYPAEMPELQDRLPLEAIVHNEVYTPFSADAIDKLYAAKEALPDTAKFIAENGKETLAQVFTDVRYTKENNEYFSKILLDVLCKQGYLK